MTHAGSPCPLCDNALELQQLPESIGEESPMRLTLRNLPVLSCAAPHRYFVGKSFPIWLLDTLRDEELPKIPAGAAKGLLFKKHTCGRCGGALGAAGEPARHAASLAWKETPAFSVEIEVPVHRCQSCGAEQARSGEELAKLLPAALVHAFKAAGIKAPG